MAAMKITSEACMAAASLRRGTWILCDFTPCSALLPRPPPPPVLHLLLLPPLLTVLSPLLPLLPRLLPLLPLLLLLPLPQGQGPLELRIKTLRESTPSVAGLSLLQVRHQHATSCQFCTCYICLLQNINLVLHTSQTSPPALMLAFAGHLYASQVPQSQGPSPLAPWLITDHVCFACFQHILSTNSLSHAFLL